jgi:DNA-binding PadR family transcriptional regulator
MRAEALKDHLDGLLLASLEAGPHHGYAIMEALRAGSGGHNSICRPGRSTRRYAAWSEPAW